MSTSRKLSVLAGILVANSAPHLASAATGRRHMTPMGRESGPGANAVWGGLNLAAGLGLLAWAHRGGERHWDEDLLAFEAGYLVFAGWMAASERFLRVNHPAPEMAAE